MATNNAINRSLDGVRPIIEYSLPNEILVRIGELVENDSTHSTIQNMRLACRPLNNIMSHLLLDSVTLDLNPRSLSRLLEISQHPTIRRGVKTVEVSLLSYSSVLANSYHAIQQYFTEPIANITSQDYMTPYDYYERAGVSSTVVGNRLYEARNILWQYWAYSTDLDKVDDQSSLGEVYHRYQELFIEQTNLLEGVEFVSTVAAAFARLSFMHNLEFNDYEYAHDFLLSKEPNVEKSLLDILLLPKSWMTAKEWRLGTPSSTRVLLTLPGAMYRAGCKPLQKLEISVSRPEDFWFLDVHNRRDLHDIYKIVQDLKHFSLLPVFEHYMYGERREFEKSEISAPFISALLNTTTLERLVLNLGNRRQFDATKDRQSLSLTTILQPRMRNSLTKMHLVAFSIHISALRQFMDGLPTNIYHLYLRNIRIENGTWAEALDLLRDKTYYSMTIVNPTGNDGDAVWMEDRAVFDNVFEIGRDDHPGLSKADAYVMKFQNHNPLMRGNWGLDEEMHEESVASEETTGELEWESTVVQM